MSMPKKLQLKHISDREILEAVKAFTEANRRFWDSAITLEVGLARKPPETPEVTLAGKYPEKLILCKMQLLDERGLLDYGVSLRTAWLTDEGKAYLAKLQST